MFEKINRYNAEFPFPEGSVSVHDPAVFYDDETQKYYVFGTHFAVASSSDLINWTQLSVDGDSSLLYGTKNFRNILAKSNAFVKGNQNTWAPHLEKLGGKYYMYYSLTAAFGSSRSVIGRVSADSVLGPYANEEIIVKSEGPFNFHEPNCIDPNLFYDADGRLWLVYGSYFAGVYLKELYAAGKKAGLPKENGFGKLLWKGGDEVVEGPFIFYNAETKFYYLMTSCGDLAKNYNMRVARSRNPDGPYYDITGTNMASVYGGGNKLAGNFQFVGEKFGYAALGHNSVLKRNGEYFVICHARFRISENQVSGGHRVQVRQLYFNAEGWPVLSPDCYAGERLCKLTAADIKGEYEVVLHSTGNDAKFVSSVPCSFTENGAVLRGGTAAGSWSVSGENFLTVTINGTVYKGVAAPSKTAGVSFTATSAAGGSLWGKKKI